MNTQVRHVVALVVLFASASFGVSVAAENGTYCVAPYERLGHVEDFSQQDVVPRCERSEPARPEPPVGCETIGPTIAHFGLSSSVGSGVAFAPACMTTLQIVSAPAAPVVVPEPLMCETTQVNNPVIKRCP